MGVFVALEGIDGAGKTTIRRRLFEALESADDFCLMCGQHSWLDPASARIIINFRENRVIPDPQVLRDAYIRDKVFLSKQIVEPALGVAHVIADRYIYSDAVYQEILFGLSAIDTIDRHVQLGTRLPDLIIFVDTDPHIAFERVRNRSQDKRYYESEDFLRKAVCAYQNLFFGSSASRTLPAVMRFENNHENWQSRFERTVLPVVERLKRKKAD